MKPFNRTLRLHDLATHIDEALEFEPSLLLREFCGAYYSPYYLFMNHMANRLGENGLLVELGCDMARGLVSLALSGKQVVGIDHTHKPGVAKAQAAFKNIVFLEQDSDPVPEWFANQDKKITLLHIDTEHSYSMAKAEFEAYEHLLDIPSVVIFDDLHAQEDAVLEYFMSLPYPKIQDDRLHPECGWGVILYTG